MRKTLTMVLTTVLVLFAGLVSSGIALAQTPPPPPPDTFAVNYYSNANTSGQPDATVRIVNPGTSGGTLCALIYVFTPDQQMAECCGCALTHNALRTLSVNSDLTSNPLTSAVPTTGAIKIVSSAPTALGLCNPRNPVPTAALRSWATHIQNPTGALTPSITETEFLDAKLSNAELNQLKNKCSSIIGNGSGHGVCTCGTGD